MVGGVLLNTFDVFLATSSPGLFPQKIGVAGILVPFFLFYLPLMFGFSAECGCG